MQKLVYSIILIIGIIGISHNIANANEQWAIKTKHDRFVIKKGNGEQYFIGRQAVQSNAFDHLRDFVDHQLAFLESSEDAVCEKPRKKPDLQITKTKAGQKGKDILVYIQESEHLVISNNKCSSLTGEGVLGLPVDRSWYIGPKTVAIDLGNRRRWNFGDSKFIEYYQKESKSAGVGAGEEKVEKILANNSMIPEWEKIHAFEETLSSIDIIGRRHLSYSKNSSHFDFMTGGKQYRFYEIRNGQGLIWALKLPDKPFLIISHSFNWGEFNLDYITGSNSGIIAILKDSQKPDNERIKALRQLGNYWNSSFQQILFTILKDEGESESLRKIITEALVQKPTALNKKVLLEVLISTQEDSLRRYISRRLSLLYPKGQAILRTDDSFTITEKMNVWRGMQ